MYTFQFQVGLTTYGKDCGFGYPVVLIQIQNYIDWIDSIIFGKLKPVSKTTECQHSNGKPGKCVRSSICQSAVEKNETETAEFSSIFCESVDTEDPVICCPTKTAENDLSSKFFRYLSNDSWLTSCVTHEWRN